MIQSPWGATCLTTTQVPSASSNRSTRLPDLPSPAIGSRPTTAPCTDAMPPACPNPLQRRCNGTTTASRTISTCPPTGAGQRSCCDGHDQGDAGGDRRRLRPEGHAAGGVLVRDAVPVLDRRGP